ncbi:MAG: peptide ABC transporter substrate-binding protein [Chloroflexi bacterium]|nr:peptide ABC transporter substrate-binding protein [Chloroflexota bacterium]
MSDIDAKKRPGRAFWGLSATCAWAILLLSCAPAPQGAGPGGEGKAGTVTGPKTLRIGSLREPDTDIALFQGSTGDTGGLWPALYFHSGLTVYDAEGKATPRLAAKIPSVQDGDWKVLPEGGMEVTWKLRPNVKWHDGQPFTSADLLLGAQTLKDPELDYVPRGAFLSSVSGFAAPDPQTFVMTWNQIYILANEIGPRDVPAIASHVVGQLYASGDKVAYRNSPYWGREWVGLGPYRIGERVPGSHLEGIAFDEYFLGRPKIDRIVIRFFSDVNVMIAPVISGDLDFVHAGAFSSAHAQTLRQQWQSQGGGTITQYPIGLSYNPFNFGIPELPWVKDVRLRRALVHMMDRQAYVEEQQFGQTKVADTLPIPADPLYKLVEQRGLSRYPYDLAQAQRLMGEGGWTRGADGLYRNASGQTFDIVASTSAVSDDSVRATLIVSGMWKAAGLNATSDSVPSTAPAEVGRRARSELHGVWSNVSVYNKATAMDEMQTSQIRVDNNGIAIGRNSYRYSNPVFDRAFDKYYQALDPNQRMEARADVLKIVSDDVPFIPLFYAFQTISQAVRKGVTGPGPLPGNQASSGWNMHEWDIT